MTKKIWWFILPLLLLGCTTTITNLTPSIQVRNPEGLYPIEAAWQTRKGRIRHESLKGSVLVGNESYPLQPTPLVSNRWETLVSIPADKDTIFYQFRFDYQYDHYPQRQSNSIASTPQRLKIKEK